MLLIAAVQAGASRQVVAAVAAGLRRPTSGAPQPQEEGEQVGFDSELKARMAAIEEPVRAQMQAAAVSGLSHHRAQGLVGAEAILKANVAKQCFCLSMPFQEAGPAALRAVQRGQRKRKTKPQPVQSTEVKGDREEQEEQAEASEADAAERAQAAREAAEDSQKTAAAPSQYLFWLGGPTQLEKEQRAAAAEAAQKQQVVQKPTRREPAANLDEKAKESQDEPEPKRNKPEHPLAIAAKDEKFKANAVLIRAMRKDEAQQWKQEAKAKGDL